MADPEKAIIDSLYVSKLISEAFSAMKTKEFDVEKLVEYGYKMKSKVLIKRLGYLLELSGIDVHDKFRKFINERYDLLNPNLPKKENRSEKWRLMINEVLE